MEINHYFYNIMNVNKCPLKYVISLCLTVWAAGALFAQPVVSSSDSAYGRALYKRIMRLNPDSLLRAHADPAVYQRTITAESGSDSIYSREDKRWFYIDRNEFHRVIAAGPSYDTYEYIYATYKGYFYHLSREKLLHEADLAEQAADQVPRRCAAQRGRLSAGVVQQPGQGFHGLDCRAAGRYKSFPAQRCHLVGT